MRTFAVVTLPLLAACGGTRSGLPGDERVVALTPDQVMAECQYVHDAYPERMIMIGAEDIPTCVAAYQFRATNAPSCAATVAEAENCEADIYAEPDSYFCSTMQRMPISCAPIQTSDCTGVQPTARRQDHGL